METRSYYIYALKDPRQASSQAFYIGKGTGTRRFDHLNADDTRKGDRIKDIQASGAQPIVTLLAEELSEMQAIKLEAELISAFGTIDSGGLLLNSVIPTGARRVKRSDLNVPSGVQEKAQIGLALLKEAILDLAKANAKGVTNSANYLGGSKDYLTWSVLGLLMQEGKMRRQDGTKLHVAQVR